MYAAVKTHLLFPSQLPSSISTKIVRSENIDLTRHVPGIPEDGAHSFAHRQLSFLIDFQPTLISANLSFLETWLASLSNDDPAILQPTTSTTTPTSPTNTKIPKSPHRPPNRPRSARSLSFSSTLEGEADTVVGILEGR